MHSVIKNLVVLMRFLILGVLLVSLLSLPQVTVSAHNPVFVSPTGSGTDCSQSNPCSLATGISSVDPDGVIYGMGGVALPHYTTPADQDQVALINRTFNLLGGWDGTSSWPVVRDPETYPSVLDGENIHRVITITGGASSHPIIDGWTIVNGNASGLVTNCSVFVYDVAGCGGGIHVDQAEPEITHNKIYNNVAVDSSSDYGGGGGIYVLNSNGTLVRYNLIHHNDSNANGPGWGGGIYMHESGGKSSILENEIYNNEDAVQPSSNSHSGAGIQIYYGDIQVHGNYIHGNDPNDSGYRGTAIAMQYVDNGTWIDENIIVNNHGDVIVAVSYGSPIIQQNALVNPGSGNGISIQGWCDEPVDHPVLTNNFIAKHAYNVYLIGCSSSDHSDVDMLYNTLAEGEVGVYMQSKTHLVLDRSILSDHDTYGIYMNTDTGAGNSITATNLLFHANTSDYNPGVSVSNILTGDPRYVDALNGDYHLLWNSAAINRVDDTGAVSEDIDDDPRPVGGGGTPYDVGADEFCWWVYLPATLKP